MAVDGVGFYNVFWFLFVLKSSFIDVFENDAISSRI